MKMSKRGGGICAALLLLSFGVVQVESGWSEEGPETIEIGTLAQYYAPVNFDHALHVGMIKSDECAICHHHTLGTPVMDPVCLRCHAGSGEADTVACRDCHPAKRFSAEYLASLEEDVNLYHVEKPGFQGAIHQCCMGCHEEQGAPTGCQDCHARTDTGDKLFYSGKYAPSAKASGH